MIGYPSPTRARAGDERAAADRPWLSPGAVFLGAVLIASLAAVIRPVGDTDYWLHVRVGRWIVEHGALPAHDLFTYTVPDHRWVDHEYLGEVLMWLLQSRLGLAGVSVAAGLVAWLGLVLVLAACRPGERPYPIVGLGLALGAVAAGPIWGPRPQIVTFALLSLELLWLRRSLEGSSRAILWLPAVMAIWSNLHGGWPAGLLFLGVAAAAELLRWLADRSQPSHLARARRLAIVGGLSALAVGLNPNGLAIYAYPFQTLASAAQQDLIREWASPDFHLAALRPLELMVLLLVAGMAAGRASLFDVLAALTGLALALASVRHVPLFVAAATPVLVATWSDAWRRAGAALPRLARASPSRLGAALGLVALAGVSGVIGARVAGDLGRQPELARQVVPVGAADWLAAHPDVGTRMFNEYAWGGYLADRFAPDPNRRLFIVSEGVLVGDEQLLRYRQVASIGPDWRRELDRAGVDYVVFDRGSPLDELLATQPDWRLVYRDETAVVYVRSRSRLAIGDLGLDRRAGRWTSGSPDAAARRVGPVV